MIKNYESYKQDVELYDQRNKTLQNLISQQKEDIKQLNHQLQRAREDS